MPTPTRQRISLVTVGVRVWLSFSFAAFTVMVVYGLIVFLGVAYLGPSTTGSFDPFSMMLAPSVIGLGVGVLVASFSFWQGLAEWSQLRLANYRLAYFGSMLLIVGPLVIWDLLFPPKYDFPGRLILGSMIGLGTIVVGPIQRGWPYNGTLILGTILGAIEMVIFLGVAGSWR